MLQQWGATRLHILHTLRDGFALREQTHGKPLHTVLFVSVLLHGRLSAGCPGSELGVICVVWDSDSRSVRRRYMDELEAFMGVDLQAGLESWQEEHEDSLCHRKKETANNWEKEEPWAFSRNTNLQQGQVGGSHWAWVTGEEQPGVKIWSWSNRLLYAMAASLLGLEQRQLCQFATITVQRLWVPWHKIIDS